MLQLKRLGFEVRVISKVFDWQNKEEIIKWGDDNTIVIDLLEYEFAKGGTQKITKFLNPSNWDGAAYEYKLSNTHNRVKEIADQFKPDVAWFDYTYLWPLYDLFQQKNIPIITRSINFEPSHFLQEDGKSLVNLLKYMPKYLSELKVVKKSDYIFAITPHEEKLYRKLGTKNVATLPLRSLPNILKEYRETKERDVLHLFFMGASYTVHHNRKAAELIIKHIAPEVERQAPGKFLFHILGKKLPEDLAKLCHSNIKEEGFVRDLSSFLEEFDIAVIPSLMGAGMQQKIFEPLVRGIPTITSARGLAEYPYKDNEHVLFAQGKDEFVERILRLQTVALRRTLSKNALHLSQELFSQEKLDTIVREGIDFAS